MGISLPRDEAKSAVKRHESASHPEIQCQCLECLYAREILAQFRILEEAAP
ncbi:MAG TPA: hypothetical protein PKM35_07310 [Holophaga sp.]|nr:hypothetical protein [Holophaga sp.]HPS66558.1 hypothetical protein [Holophaga sp.]